jgi:hypothetical protein
LSESLFTPWRRSDPTFSLRWDVADDVRYALQAGDPTTPAYKSGTQHGANRLAAIALPLLTVAPAHVRGRLRPVVVGGAYRRGGFTFSWPIWRAPATLSAVRAMLSHPDLERPNSLAHLGVQYVLTSRRISVGKFMNRTRGRRHD